jgi:hypothetical protein
MSRKSIFWAGILCLGCKGKPGTVAAETHLSMVRQPGAMLWVDRLDSRVVLQKADTTGNTTFCSFLVGWRDSLPVAADGQKRQDRERYFQYGMQQDWTALMDGDSLRPVFLQERPVLDQQLKEGAMVFEIPHGRRVDTLVYRDSFGAWGTQIFVLNGK